MEYFKERQPPKPKPSEYYAVHNWIAHNYGKADHCEHCDIKEGKRFEWANVSGEYKRERSDFIQLCNPCHKKFDNLNQKMWATRKKLYGPSGRRTDKIEKLTSCQVKEIRERLKLLEPHASIAKDYGVHSVTISNISLGKTWAHLITEEELTESLANRRKLKKITDDQILEIRSLVASGMSCRKVAKIFNITHQTVSDIKNRKRRSNVV